MIRTNVIVRLLDVCVRGPITASTPSTIVFFEVERVADAYAWTEVVLVDSRTTYEWKETIRAPNHAEITLKLLRTQRRVCACVRASVRTAFLSSLHTTTTTTFVHSVLACDNFLAQWGGHVNQRRI